jgi:hypothetical protein
MTQTLSPDELDMVKVYCSYTMPENDKCGKDLYNKHDLGKFMKEHDRLYLEKFMVRKEQME